MITTLRRVQYKPSIDIVDGQWAIQHRGHACGEFKVMDEAGEHISWLTIVPKADYTLVNMLTMLFADVATIPRSQMSMGEEVHSLTQDIAYADVPQQVKQRIQETQLFHLGARGYAVDQYL